MILVNKSQQRALGKWCTMLQVTFVIETPASFTSAPNWIIAKLLSPKKQRHFYVFPVYCSHWLISIPWKHFDEMLVSLIRLFYGKMPKIASNNNPHRETYEKSRTLCEYNRKSHRIFRAERKNASCSNKSHKAHTQKAI